MRIGRLIGAFVTTILLVCALQTGIAHAEDDYLVGSDPQPRQELNETPGSVTLAFRTKASAKLAKILVLDAAGANVTNGALIVEGTNVTTYLQFELPKGTYSVYYRTSNADGQPRGGAFQFAYGKGEWTTLDKEVWVGEAEQPPILTNPDPNATEPGTPTASATPTATIQPTQTTPATDPTASASPDATATPVAPTPGGGVPTGWLVAGGVAAAGLIGGGAVLLVRRRRSAGTEG